MGCCQSFIYRNRLQHVYSILAYCHFSIGAISVLLNPKNLLRPTSTGEYFLGQDGIGFSLPNTTYRGGFFLIKNGQVLIFSVV